MNTVHNLTLTGCLVLFLLCLMIESSHASADEWGETAISPATSTQLIRKRRPNLLGGGIGIFCVTVSYERYLTHYFGLGTGYAAYFYYPGFEYSEGVVAIPVYVVLTPLGNYHSPYLSVGVDVVLESTGLSPKPKLLAAGAAGYLYQARGGFFFRPTLRVAVSDFDIMPALSLVIGWSF